MDEVKLLPCPGVYRKRMVTVDAWQFNNDASSYDLLHWLNLEQHRVRGPFAKWINDKLIIPTPEGEMTASKGDWIIRGLRGEFYPCKPDIFEMTHEPVTERTRPPIVTDAVVEPIPMMLFCPKCGLQHVDAPDDRTPDWTNPPHKSHLCHGCGTIWRPADVPTEGVAAIQTFGSKDTIFYNRAAIVAMPTIDQDGGWIEHLRDDVPEPPQPCPTCGAKHPFDNVFCSDGFHAPPAQPENDQCQD